jgi:hypothetical protein
MPVRQSAGEESRPLGRGADCYENGRVPLA